jgi:hypothetical protein
MRIEPVNSRITRCRMIHDTLRLCKQGIRDLVIERCCARHHVRVRLTPWHPMGEWEYTLVSTTCGILPSPGNTPAPDDM